MEKKQQIFRDDSSKAAFFRIAVALRDYFKAEDRELSANFATKEELQSIVENIDKIGGVIDVAIEGTELVVTLAGGTEVRFSINCEYANKTKHAVYADKLTIFQNINLTGPITGTGVFTGNSSCDIETAIDPDAFADYFGTLSEEQIQQILEAMFEGGVSVESEEVIDPTTGETKTVVTVVIKGNERVEGDLEVEGDATVDGNETVKGNEEIEGDLTVDGDLLVKGNEEVKKDLVVDGDATIKGDEEVVGNLTVDSDEEVIGNLTVDSDEEVKGNLTVNGNATVKSDAEVDGDLLVKGNEEVQKDLTVDGNTNIKGNLTVTGTITSSSSGTIVADQLGTATVGGSATPIYLDAGKPKACGYSFTNYLPLSGGTCTGAVNATSFQATSDRRVKTIVGGVAPGLYGVSAYRFKWNDPEKMDDRIHIGLMAQDVFQVLPEAITVNEETGLMRLDYNAVTAALVGTVNALTARVEELEGKVKENGNGSE